MNPLGRPPVDPQVRWWSHVEPEPMSGCWLWTSGLQGSGYGSMWVGSGLDGTRRKELVHRLAYEWFVGPIPDGLLVLHTCDVRICVRPSHLFLGTQLENVADCIAKGRRWDPIGELAPAAKLRREQVLEILGRPTDRVVVLATEYGVQPRQIRRIRTGDRWVKALEVA